MTWQGHCVVAHIFWGFGDVVEGTKKQARHEHADASDALEERRARPMQCMHDVAQKHIHNTFPKAPCQIMWFQWLKKGKKIEIEMK